MKTYQITLKGFDVSTDKTDHLIKWINAPSLKAVKAYGQRMKWHIESIEKDLWERPLMIEDGVDAILDAKGCIK